MRLVRLVVARPWLLPLLLLLLGVIYLHIKVLLLLPILTFFSCLLLAF